MALKLELRLYDELGERQPLPDRFVAGLNFELLERGGCGTFSLVLVSELDERSLPALPAADWRLDVLLGGEYIYRGYVERVRRALMEPPGQAVYRIDGAGLMARVQSFLVDAAYTRPFGVDVSEVFGWIAARFLAGEERLGEFVQAIETPIGFTLEHVDLFGANVRTAFDRLAEAAEDSLIWGFDVTPGGENRLYVRKRSTAVTNEDYRFRVGKDAAALELPEDVSELANALRLIGGKAKAPNLVYNPSFELPRNPGEGPEGNLLQNHSFESEAAWTFGGSAARQETSGEPGEYARTGNWFAEVDAPGDYVQQTVDLVATGAEVPYLLQFYYAKQQPSQDAVLWVTVEERDGAGNALATPVDQQLDVTARSYQEARIPFVTQHAGTQRLRVRLEWVSGTDILLDDVALFEAGQLINQGWQRENRGSARGELDWASQEDPFHGVYCVRASITGADGTAANSVRIRPTKEHWAAVRDKTQHVVKVRVRGAAGQKLRVGLQRRGGGGGSDYKFSNELALAGTGTWETFSVTLSSTDKTEIRPVVELRSNGVYYLDAVEVYEDGVEARGDEFFLDGEDLVFYFRTDNGGNATPLDLSQLTPEAQASIATYGLREQVVEVEEIEDLESARSYAVGYFNRHAVPLRQGRLTLEPCDVPVRFVEAAPEATPTGQIAVAGAKVAIPDQNPARIEYSLGRNGALRCDIDLTTRRPDPALLLKRALSGGGRGGGGGGAGTNLRSSPGNSVPGGDEGSAPTWQVNDLDAGTRSRLDLVGGTAVLLTGTDDEANDRVRVVASVDLGSGAGQAAPGNHSHALAGDVSGDTSATVVGAIQGKAVPEPTAAEDGKALTYDSATGAMTWSDAGNAPHNLLSATHSDTVPAASPPLGAMIRAAGSPAKWTQFYPGSGGTVLMMSNGLPTWFSINGDVTGAANNLFVNRIRGKNVPEPGALEDGKFLRYNHALGACEWSAMASVSVGGDLSGTTDNATVVRLQGKTLPVPGPSEDGKYIRYDAATDTYQFTAPVASVGGDLSGTTSNATVAQIQNKPVPAPGASEDGLFLRYNHTSGAMEWATTGGAVGPHELLDPTVHTDTIPYSGGTPPHGSVLTTNADGLWYPLPPGQVGQVLTIGDVALGAFKTGWSFPSPAALPLGYRDALSNAGTVKGQVPTAEGKLFGFTAHAKMFLRAIVVDLDQDLSGSAGDWYEAEIYYSSGGAAYAATFIKARITVGSGNQRSAYVDANPGGGGSTYLLEPGDSIVIFDQRSGLAGSTVAARVTVLFHEY